VRGVHALDVEGRVGLGVTETLRFLEHDLEGQALVAHLGEDEVGGAVDDPGDPLDAVGGEPFAQALMIGMPPATAASKATMTPFFWAAAKISLPCLASRALLAVTTCLPWSIACSTRTRATS
jgi:hypothetical protein